MSDDQPVDDHVDSEPLIAGTQPAEVRLAAGVGANVISKSIDVLLMDSSGQLGEVARLHIEHG